MSRKKKSKIPEPLTLEEEHIVNNRECFLERFIDGDPTEEKCEEIEYDYQYFKEFVAEDLKMNDEQMGGLIGVGSYKEGMTGIENNKIFFCIDEQHLFHPTLGITFTQIERDKDLINYPKLPS